MRRPDFLGEGFAVILTAIQENEFLQLISFILTLISIAVSIAFTVYKWYKEAKEDGHISKEEIEDLEKKLEDKLGKKNKNDK